MRDSPDLCHAEEAMHSTFNTVQESLEVDAAATAQTVNHLLPNDIQAKYLNKYSQFPATKQHFFAGWLWIMEGCCLLQTQKPEAALDAFKKGAAVMDSLYSPGNLQLFFDSCRITGVSMALGYLAEAYTLLSKIWEDFVPYTTQQSDPRGPFIDATTRYALPWWHGTTKIAADKMAALTRMALEVSSTPSGKVKEKIIYR